MLELEWWNSRMRWLGMAAIALSILTWGSEIAGIVYVCPYCRTQRTIIGLLGILMLMPNPRHWISRYLATVLALYGFHVGAAQHFGGWKKIMKGEFEWGAEWYVNSWMLSGFALFIITGLALLIWQKAPISISADSEK
jgi:disulfide bond formation protein DsbB